jgi:hypothetical protein
MIGEKSTDVGEPHIDLINYMTAEPNIVKPEIIIEQEVRELRDKVFVTPIDDNGWNQCKENWLKPSETQWLREHQPQTH